MLGTRGFPDVQGGVEIHCQNLYHVLAKLGCEIVVFTRRPYVNSNIKEYKGVKLISLPIIRHKSIEAFLHTLIGVFAALRYSPDILHIHGIGPSLFAPLARIFGMKVVMTSHGSNYKHLKWGRFAKLILRFGELIGVFYASEVIAISQNIADEIKKNYNRVVAVIPNGVTIPSILKTDNILKKYSLERGKYVLAVGRFVPEKGFHDLIDAFNQIQNPNSLIQISTSNLEPRTSELQTPNSEFVTHHRPLTTDNCPLSTDYWKLVIVGRADHEDRYSLGLKEKARKNSNVILTGFLTGEPLHELYSYAGLFALPSYYEGLPIVLLEAMSYGLSCIASDIPANRNVELSEDRFFKAGDVKALAIKIKEFIDKPLSEEDRKRQIRIISERYDWEKIAEKTLQIYSKLLTKKKGSSVKSMGKLRFR